jgi:hypothetical protein
MSGTAVGDFHFLITCLICEDRIEIWQSDIRMECQCGAEYCTTTGQLVEDEYHARIGQAGRGTDLRADSAPFDG